MNLLRPEQHIGILVKTLLKRDNEKLALGKVLLNDHSEVLCMRQVQGGVHLVEDVERSRVVLQKREQKRQGQQSPLSSRELRQRVLPLSPEGDLDLESLLHLSVLLGLFDQEHFGLSVRQEVLEDLVQVRVDFLEALQNRLTLLDVQLLNAHVDVLLVLDDRLLLEVKLLQVLVELLELLFRFDFDLLFQMLRFLLQMMRLALQVVDHVRELIHSVLQVLQLDCGIVLVPLHLLQLVQSLSLLLDVVRDILDLSLAALQLLGQVFESLFEPSLFLLEGLHVALEHSQLFV